MTESFLSRIRAGFEGYLNSNHSGIRSIAEFSESTALTKFATTTPTLIPQYYFQNIFRPLWGKQGITLPTIGDHPDFKHLSGTSDLIYCPIATLFMDIESSTRLGVIYTPEEVFKIKNAFIATAIDIIQSFDGHVHRIMGDAVMAFFGGLNVQPENAIIQALNAAATIQYVVKKAIIPKLNQSGFESQFGIRIGLDYGRKDSVLWSSYGFPGSQEVTATSFFVDAASKLQHAAPRNSIMLGQSLRDFIYFPRCLLSLKKLVTSGETIEEPYLTPNITDRDKRPINYKQFVFDSIDYLKCSPLASVDGDMFGFQNGLGPISISIGISSSKEGPIENQYYQCGGFIPKEKWLCFEVKYNGVSDLRMPLKIRFEVENHGEEAEKAPNNGNHYQEYDISSTKFFRNGVKNWESTKYRGLHYLNIAIFFQGERKFQISCGICIL